MRLLHLPSFLLIFHLVQGYGHQGGGGGQGASTGDIEMEPLPKDGEDSHEWCCWWAQTEECQNNPFWMRPYCQNSCGTPACTIANALDCAVGVNLDGCPWSGGGSGGGGTSGRGYAAEGRRPEMSRVAASMPVGAGAPGRKDGATARREPLPPPPLLRPPPKIGCPNPGPPAPGPGSPCFAQEFTDNNGCPRRMIICGDPTQPPLPPPPRPPPPPPGMNCPEPMPHPGPDSACMVQEFTDEDGCLRRSIACPDPPFIPPPAPPLGPGPRSQCPDPESKPRPDSPCTYEETTDQFGCLIRTIICPDRGSPAVMERPGEGCPEPVPDPGPDSACFVDEFTDENGCLVRAIACPDPTRRPPPPPPPLPPLPPPRPPPLACPEIDPPELPPNCEMSTFTDQQGCPAISVQCKGEPLTFERPPPARAATAPVDRPPPPLPPPRPPPLACPEIDPPVISPNCEMSTFTDERGCPAISVQCKGEPLTFEGPPPARAAAAPVDRPLLSGRNVPESGGGGYGAGAASSQKLRKNGKPSGGCKDNNSLCNFWRFKGECRKNPNGMNQHCPKACGKC